MPSAKSPLQLPAPVPTPGRAMPTKLKDERRSFARITKQTPRDESAELAFVATKAHMIRTHPGLGRSGRPAAFAELVQRVGHVATAAAEDPYYCTNRMGSLNTMLISRSASGAWGSWQLLGAPDSSIRTDNVGFFQTFLDAKYSLIVDS